MKNTNKLLKYVAKRINATRDDPQAEPTVLGFVEGASIMEAGRLAQYRWPEDGENQLVYLTPLNQAKTTDIVLATEAQSDEVYGPSYGKRRRVVCTCGSACYFHPKQKRERCYHCKKKLVGLPDLLVDMPREVRSWNVQ